MKKFIANNLFRIIISTLLTILVISYIRDGLHVNIDLNGNISNYQGEIKEGKGLLH